VRDDEAEQHVAAVSRDDDDGAVAQARQQVLDGHRPDEHLEDLAREQLRVAHREATAHGLHERGDGGRHEEGLLRQGPGRSLAEQRAAHLDLVGGAAVGDHADRLGVVGVELAEGDVDDVADLLGRALLARDHEQHGGAEVRRDARVEGELGRAGHVGVVRADDDDGVALAGHRVVPRDDRREGRLLVLVDVLVGDADAVLVGQVDAVVPEQELEHVVTLLGAAGDRPVDAHALHATGEQVEEAEGHRRLPRLALGRRHVDGARAHSIPSVHAPRLLRRAPALPVSSPAGAPRARTSGR